MECLLQMDNTRKISKHGMDLGRWECRKEIVCVFCWLQWLHTGWERVAICWGWEARKTRRGRYSAACFFFSNILASLKCLSHANKACLKLIELTEAASETKPGNRGKRVRKVSEQGKGKLITTRFFFFYIVYRSLILSLQFALFIWSK